eukprot:COSAG01_NODE_2128_length_8364_cov_100.246461_2_plen_187_part_00
MCQSTALGRRYSTKGLLPRYFFSSPTITNAALTIASTVAVTTTAVQQASAITKPRAVSGGIVSSTCAAAAAATAAEDRSDYTGTRRHVQFSRNGYHADSVGHPCGWAMHACVSACVCGAARHAAYKGDDSESRHQGREIGQHRKLLNLFINLPTEIVQPPAQEYRFEPANHGVASQPGEPTASTCL